MFTVRQMMIAVVAVAVMMAAGVYALKLQRRSEEYRRRASFHNIGANPDWYLSPKRFHWPSSCAFMAIGSPGIGRWREV